MNTKELTPEQVKASVELFENLLCLECDGFALSDPDGMLERAARNFEEVVSPTKQQKELMDEYLGLRRQSSKRLRRSTFVKLYARELLENVAGFKDAPVQKLLALARREQKIEAFAEI
jgi:hypothetical protein